MIRPRPSIALVLLALPALSIAGEPAGPFRHDPRAAFEEASGSGRPLLIDFRTTWCVACREMDRTTWKDQGVLERLARFVPLEIDGDRNANLTARYRVDAYPTIVFAAPDGTPILELLGLQDARAMREHLDAVARDLERLSSWALEAESRRPDPGAVIGLAEFARQRGAAGQAEDLYRQILRRRRSYPAALVDRARAGLAALLAGEGECREARRLIAEIDRSGVAGEEISRLEELASRCR